MDISLAHAYVVLDRFVFFQLQQMDFRNLRARVKERLAEHHALNDLKDLCEARAERDELLWLLHGCDGLPGFTRTEEVFGLAAQDLRNSLATIERAANAIERMYSYTFGLLARHTLTSSLDEELRSYVALARQARTDFGHGSQWFLNIAKARLVIHVRSRTNGAVHDKEISALISAMTDTSYAPSAQSRWRHKHSDLIRDDSLDPYTVMNQRDRKRKRKKWEELAAVDPAFMEHFLVKDYKQVGKARNRPTYREQTYVEDPPTIARGGRGIVVAGCPACKKRLQSMNEFLRHLAEDAMPPLLDRLSSEGKEREASNTAQVTA